jgi:hypothetical protein
VSLKSDAEAIMDLAAKIVSFEILRPQVQAGTAVLFDNGDAVVTLTAAQKQSLLAIEESWKASIKSISGAW